MGTVFYPFVLEGKFTFGMLREIRLRDCRIVCDCFVVPRRSRAPWVYGYPSVVVEHTLNPARPRARWRKKIRENFGAGTEIISHFSFVRFLVDCHDALQSEPGLNPHNMLWSNPLEPHRLMNSKFIKKHRCLPRNSAKGLQCLKNEDPRSRRHQNDVVAGETTSPNSVVKTVSVTHRVRTHRLQSLSDVRFTL